MLTAKEMQDLLLVDRSTIYRMAEAGQLPAVKVGKQWRFPRDLVESWLKTQTIQSENLAPRGDFAPKGDFIPNGDFASMLPLDCVQLIQDTFADALGVMIVVTDMEGHPVTQVSHPCGLFVAISRVPNAVQKCIEGWHDLATSIDLEPKFTPSHLGLLCARGMVRIGAELKGMVMVGGIAPDNWPPSPDEMQAIADDLGVAPDVLAAHTTEVFYLDEHKRAWVLSFVQRIANIVSHIASERYTLVGKLESIAKLTAL